MSARSLAPAVLVLALTAGCGPDPVPAASPSSSVPPAPPPSATAPSSPLPAAPTAPVGTRPVVECLNGTYRLTRLVDVSAGASYAGGSGGDVELRFSGEEFPDGNYVGTAYTLDAAGKRALTLTSPDGATSRLVVEAQAKGSYTLSDSQATFALGPGKGSGRLTSSGATRTLTLAQVQEIVTPVGTLTVSCTKTTLWLTGAETQLELRAV